MTALWGTIDAEVLARPLIGRFAFGERACTEARCDPDSGTVTLSDSRFEPAGYSPIDLADVQVKFTVKRWFGGSGSPPLMTGGSVSCFPTHDEDEWIFACESSLSVVNLAEGETRGPFDANGLVLSAALSGDGARVAALRVVAPGVASVAIWLVAGDRRLVATEIPCSPGDTHLSWSWDLYLAGSQELLGWSANRKNRRKILPSPVTGLRAAGGQLCVCSRASLDILCETTLDVLASFRPDRATLEAVPVEGGVLAVGFRFARFMRPGCPDISFQVEGPVRLACYRDRSVGIFAVRRLRGHIMVELVARFRSPYTFAGKIGSGSQGTVFKATTSVSGTLVAVKKLKDGECWDSHHECMLIRELQAHPNIVRLIDICQNSYTGRLQCSIVMEYMAVDLQRVMELCRKDGVHLKDSVSRTLSVNLLAGLEHIHSHHIVHRDIKPPNLLVSRDLTTLKISDFGSSRRFIPGLKLNSYACTRWYRPPELFLQCCVAYDAVVARRGNPQDMTQVEYMQSTSGCAEDIWSAGCVCMEMARCDAPTFMQNSWRDMLEAITRVIGSPEIEDLREMCRYFDREIIPEQVESTLSERIFAFDEDVQCMLAEMLKWNPRKRTSALGAALHLTKGREYKTSCQLEYDSI